MTENYPPAGSAPGDGQPGGYGQQGYGQAPQGQPGPGGPGPQGGYGQPGGYAPQGGYGQGAPQGLQQQPQASGGNAFGALFQGDFSGSAIARFASTFFWIGVGAIVIDWLSRMFLLTTDYTPGIAWVDWIFGLAAVLLKIVLLRGFIELVVAVTRNRN